MKLAVCASMVLGLCASIAPVWAGELLAFRIGTGGPGGTYYPVGQALARAITTDPDCHDDGCGIGGMHAVAQFSTGSVANIRDLADGHLEAGLAQADVVHMAFHGEGPFLDDGPFRELRLIGGLFRESIHLVARADAGVHSVIDLPGRRVSLDHPGSGSLHSARRVLGAFDLDEGTIRIHHLPAVEAARQLSRNELDAFFATAGYPMPVISSLAAATAVVLVPLDGPAARGLVEREPFFSIAAIPDGAYPGTAATPTLAVSAQLVVSSTLDEAQAYALTRSLWSESARDLLMAAHPRGAEIVLEHALTGASIPLHPGAERYYREVGLVP